MRRNCDVKKGIITESDRNVGAKKVQLSGSTVIKILITGSDGNVGAKKCNFLNPKQQLPKPDEAN
jgi:hypothetical protein